MVRAGTQKMSLPDIYKMFKTASDEDKIKLMNTYSNLGERFGEYDKDIAYRRRFGDKDALTEKMYTEGIGDVLGSAWDYTKQGAETAWHYVKKGAKKGAESLRDLVMRDTAVNDLVRGDEYIDEEPEVPEEPEVQLPVNDTQLLWDVYGDETEDNPMSKSEGEALTRSEPNPYDSMSMHDPEAEAEDEADIGPLDLRDLNMSLYELMNKPIPEAVQDQNKSLFDAVNEPESEPESETLSPQEQRFLGADSSKKEEVVESPMARRARERLDKLTAEQEYYDNNPNARWSDLYNIDPERATFDWNRIAPKGSGAAGTVQARLEHDAEIDKQIAVLNTQLRKDMLENGWTSTSPEFLDRYGEIQELEASKFVKRYKNAFEKTVGLTDKETSLALDAKKQEFSEEKERTRIDEKAFEVTNKAMGDLMGEKYNMPAKYGLIASSLNNAVTRTDKDGNININEASIKLAIKAFIQAIDNSVVMAHEAASFTDQSTMGRIRATLQGFYDENIYSPDRLEEIWDNMNAYMETYKQGISNIAKSGEGFYTTYGGQNPAVFDAWVDLMTSDAALPPKPDFSVVQPWWEKYLAKSKAGGKGGGLKAPVYGGGGNGGGGNGGGNNDEDDVGEIQ